MVHLFLAVALCLWALAVLMVRIGTAKAVQMGPDTVMRLLGSLGVESVFGGCALFAVKTAFTSPSLSSIAAAVLFVALLFPYPIARAILVPLGWHEGAWRLALLSHVSFWNDRRGGAVATGAHALMRGTGCTPQALASLERLLAPSLIAQPADRGLDPWIRKIFRMPHQCRANAMYAVGAICAARGDLHGARRAFGEVEQARDADSAAEAVRMAREWRCADAVERGDWDAVVRVGRLGRPRPTARVRFMVAVARRMIGQADAPDDDALSLLWARCPFRKRLEPLLARARAVPVGSAPVPPEAPSDIDDALGRALSLHLRLSRGPVSQPVEALRALGQAWDEALHAPTLRAGFLARAGALGAPNGRAVLDDLASQVQAEMAGFVVRDSIDVEALETSSKTLQAVGRHVRDERLRALETSVAMLRRRVDSDRRLPGRIEHQELDELLRQYADIVAVSGQRGRERAFYLVYETLSAYGVWLFNKRRQRKLGHVVFCFIMMQACIVGDEVALDLHARNANLGY